MYKEGFQTNSCNRGQCRSKSGSKKVADQSWIYTARFAKSLLTKATMKFELWNIKCLKGFSGALTLYLTCRLLAFQIQQQIKIWCQKYWQMGIQFTDWVENIVGKEEIARNEQVLLFPQCFQKLSVVDALKWVSME